jgi:hypothetical protein
MMKYCRFLYGGQTLYGAVDTRSGSLQIVGLTEVPEEDPHFRLAHGRASSFNYSFEPIPLSEADLLTPVTPSKIVCVGHNSSSSRHRRCCGRAVRWCCLQRPSVWISKASWPL